MDREKVIKAWECCVPFNRQCNKCPYEKDCYHDGISRHMVADAITMLKEQEEISWTKCADKLPDANGEYLVVKSIMGQFNKIDVCAFTRNLNGIDEFDFPTENRPGWYEYDSENGYFELTGITHWAKLPQMPDEKEQSNDRAE